MNSQTIATNIRYPKSHSAPFYGNKFSLLTLLQGPHLLTQELVTYFFFPLFYLDSCEAEFICSPIEKMCMRKKERIPFL